MACITMIVIMMICFGGNAAVIMVVISVRVGIAVVVRIFYLVIVVINVQHALPHVEFCRLNRQASKKIPTNKPTQY